MNAKRQDHRNECIYRIGDPLQLDISHSQGILIDRFIDFPILYRLYRSCCNLCLIYQMLHKHQIVEIEMLKNYGETRQNKK